MDVKEFKLRALHGLIRPRYFYIPVKTEEEETISSIIIVIEDEEGNPAYVTGCSISINSYTWPYDGSWNESHTQYTILYTDSSDTYIFDDDFRWTIPVTDKDNYRVPTPDFSLTGKAPTIDGGGVDTSSIYSYRASFTFTSPKNRIKIDNLRPGRYGLDITLAPGWYTKTYAPEHWDDIYTNGEPWMPINYQNDYFTLQITKSGQLTGVGEWYHSPEIRPPYTDYIDFFKIKKPFENNIFPIVTKPQTEIKFVLAYLETDDFPEASIEYSSTYEIWAYQKLVDVGIYCNDPLTGAFEMPNPEYPGEDRVKAYTLPAIIDLGTGCVGTMIYVPDLSHYDGDGFAPKYYTARYTMGSDLTDLDVQVARWTGEWYRSGDSSTREWVHRHPRICKIYENGVYKGYYTIIKANSQIISDEIYGDGSQPETYDDGSPYPYSGEKCPEWMAGKQDNTHYIKREIVKGAQLGYIYNIAYSNTVVTYTPFNDNPCPDCSEVVGNSYIYYPDDHESGYGIVCRGMSSVTTYENTLKENTARMELTSMGTSRDDLGIKCRVISKHTMIYSGTQNGIDELKRKEWRMQQEELAATDPGTFHSQLSLYPPHGYLQEAVPEFESPDNGTEEYDQHMMPIYMYSARKPVSSYYPDISNYNYEETYDEYGNIISVSGDDTYVCNGDGLTTEQAINYQTIAYNYYNASQGMYRIVCEVET